MKCNQCGNENRNDSDFCVYCGARLIPESKRKHKRKNNGGHKAGIFAARGAIAVILLLCGIAVGVYIGKKMAINDSGEERLYGRRIQWAMDGRSLPFSKANVPLASNAFEQGPRDMWSPEWVDLTENNICFVDGRIFSYDFNEISVYDEDMKLIRQLSDYKIIEAYTDGSKVYMITMANADESFNDQFACWDVDRDELVFIQMIQTWPSIPQVGLAGANEEGVFYYTAEHGGREARWFMYSFDTERVLDLGLFAGSLEYVGSDFYLTKTVPFDIDWVPYAEGALYYVESDRQTRVKISNRATTFQVYDHMVYYLENTSDGGVFKCFDIYTQESSVLSEPVQLSWQSDFVLLRGGLGALFSNNPGYDENIERMVKVFNFRDESVGDSFTDEPNGYYGGYNGYVCTEKREHVYLYEPFSSGFSLYYSAPEGWYVGALLEVGKEDVYVQLIYTGDYRTRKVVKVESEIDR